MESEISGFPELIKSNSHFQMVVFRLSFVSTKKSVPPGEIKSIIAVGFVWFYRVMNPVHMEQLPGVVIYDQHLCEYEYFHG